MLQRLTMQTARVSVELTPIIAEILSKIACMGPIIVIPSCWMDI